MKAILKPLDKSVLMLLIPTFNTYSDLSEILVNKLPAALNKFNYSLT